jgi:hypothetical protein
LLLVNWHFDIFLRAHWHIVRETWNSGLPIGKSEISFLIVLASAVPLWLAGWIGLCVIKWGLFLKRTFFSPLYLYRRLRLKTKPTVVVKKKSAVEDVQTVKKATIIKKPAATKRPPLPSATLMQSNINMKSINSSTSSYGAGVPLAASKKNPEVPLDHALFNFDDDDFDLDFGLDKKDEKDEEDSIPSALMVDEPKESPREKKPQQQSRNNGDNHPRKQENNRQENNNRRENKPQNKAQAAVAESGNKESHTPILDVLKQKGYDIIPSVIIKNTTIDYVAVSKNEIMLCLADKEIGDWLADEEKFNDEEPLWFSESSHRISPVRQVDVARDILKTKLAVADLNFGISAYVIIQSGNIINAEDMFDIWRNMDINVTRINRGSPKELRLFSKIIEPCEEKTDKATIEKLKKLIRSLA